MFCVPSTAGSFRDGTPIYCPLRRMWSSVNTPFPPGIAPGPSCGSPLRYRCATPVSNVMVRLLGRCGAALSYCVFKRPIHVCIQAACLYYVVRCTLKLLLRDVILVTAVIILQCFLGHKNPGTIIGTWKNHLINLNRQISQCLVIHGTFNFGLCIFNEYLSISLNKMGGKSFF